MKILANDGISQEGIDKLQKAGFEVITETVKQEDLIDVINRENYVALLVRSATTVRKDLIDACPNLKLIGRGGVGMDNIDVEYARSKGIIVENTPAASSQSVAELAIASLFSLARSTFDSYKKMSESGESDFNSLKKKYGKGIELRGKTLLIIGFGKIGQSLASYALGVGMKVVGVTRTKRTIEIPISIHGMDDFKVNIQTTDNLEDFLGEADFITLNIPKQKDGKAVIGKAELAKMKDGVRIVNVARGGVIDEDALLEAIKSGKVGGVALDVFENEPSPRVELLKNATIACTPHIGAATLEAQARIGTELADKIIAALKK